MAIDPFDKQVYVGIQVNQTIYAYSVQVGGGLTGTGGSDARRSLDRRRSRISGPALGQLRPQRHRLGSRRLRRRRPARVPLGRGARRRVLLELHGDDEVHLRPELPAGAGRRRCHGVDADGLDHGRVALRSRALALSAALRPAAGVQIAASPLPKASARPPMNRNGAPPEGGPNFSSPAVEGRARPVSRACYRQGLSPSGTIVVDLMMSVCADSYNGALWYLTRNSRFWQVPISTGPIWTQLSPRILIVPVEPSVNPWPVFRFTPTSNEAYAPSPRPLSLYPIT